MAKLTKQEREQIIRFRLRSKECEKHWKQYVKDNTDDPYWYMK